MDVQFDTIRTGGFSADCCRFGHGDRALVILPGLNVGSVLNFAGAVADAYGLLADRFTVWLFDWRKDLPDACTVDSLARDTATAIRAAGLDRICLFGASMGGMAAMAVAAGHPDLVVKLAVGSSAARITGERYRVIGRWAGLARAGKAAELFRAFGETVYPPEVYEQLRDRLSAGAGTAAKADLERFAVLAEGIRGFDITDRLGRITCPVLVTGSADDRVLGPDSAGQIAALLGNRPDTELYMYDGYGHAAYDTAPDYKARLLRFFAPEAAE